MKCKSRIVILLIFAIGILFKITPAQIASNNFGLNPAISKFSDKNTIYIDQKKNDFSLITGSVCNVITSPLSWETHDFYIAGGFVLASFGSALLDNEIRTVSLKNKSDFLDRIEQIGVNYGAPEIAGPAALSIYLIGSFTGNNWMRSTGLMLTEMIISVGIIQIPSRIIAGRARPFTLEKNTSFELFNGIKQERSSFISGHSAIAFGFSRILSEQIDNDWASVGLYALALTTPVARLYAERHWFSDIVIGTGLGFFISNKILNWHRAGKNDENKLSIYPSGSGFRISFKF